MTCKKKLLGVIFAFSACSLLPASAEESKDKEKQKSVLMIIASKDFRDEELFTPKKVFEKNKIKVTVASTKTSKVTGMLKGSIKPDANIKKIKVKDYDSIIFVGGIGAKMLFKNKTAHKIAKEAVKEGKLLSAICLAPNILANAGVLEGKNATCYDSATLKKKGAKYQNKDVVTDGKIVTANGPKAAKKFADTIVKALSE